MKKGSEFTTKLISIVACVALAVGLMPLPAFAGLDDEGAGIPAAALALTISPAGSSPDAKAAPVGCIAFTSDAPFTVSLGPDKHWDGTIEYSLGNNEWLTYEAETPIYSGGGCAVYFRGTGNTRLSEEDGVFRHSTFSLAPSAGHTVSCSGNIETLLDYEKAKNREHPRMAGLAFYRLFFDCTSLDSAPELPATELAESCYRGMFYGCTSLTAAPELPATGLAECCYSEMFYGCTALTAAPALPATGLAERCYQDMFRGCTSLTAAPELPATGLANGCYDRMFYKCTSLTKAPALPAKELAPGCYRAMFYGCTSLTKAPALPAEKLFAVNASGTVTRFGDCYAGMFGGCTSLTEAPALPAKEMVYNCYDRMFIGCTSLTTPPALPATTLAGQCYRRMFEDSGVRLSEKPGTFNGVFYGTPYRIPSEGTGKDANDALTDMFKGTGGYFKGTPDINKTYYLPFTHVDAPSGKTLVYTGAEQTGVEPGEGYTLAGEKAAGAGDHTATATLLDGYAWSDGTVGAREVAWSIAPKPATITVSSASKAEGEADPAFTGAVEGLVADGDLGTVRYVRTGTDEAPGTYAGVLTAEYTANPNYAVSVVKGDFTIKARGVYEVVSGAGGTWTQGSGEAFTLVIKRTVDDEATFDHFAGVEVDGKAVPEKDASGSANWTAERGSVVLALQPAYLETLSEGEHTVTALFDDEEGGASASFTVAAKASPPSSPAKSAAGAAPKTGDSLGGAVAGLATVAVIALLLMVFVSYRRRRMQ